MKFKLGDRVKVLKCYTCSDITKIYGILTSLDASELFQVYNGYFYRAEELELIEEPENLTNGEK